MDRDPVERLLQTVDIPIEELLPDLERVFMGGEPTNVATPSASPVPDQSATPHS